MIKALENAVAQIYRRNFSKRTFIAGKTTVPVSGKVFDAKELVAGVSAALDGWWTEGRFARQFEKDFGSYLGRKYVTLVNSGSSANLLALSALTSASFGERALKPGDEVITCALGFPTTVNPIIQNRCVAVFADCDAKTLNIDPKDITRAITKKTKAIIVAHTLGNPMDIDTIAGITKKHSLWFIEDCCDALGSTYRGKLCGTFGDIATFSFYPAHQITMGEGGAIVTSNPLIHRGIRQLRDWGRDCWCGTGEDNTCRKRFGWKLGELPMGYDNKYIYSQIGYNMKLTDMQAAIGVAQFKKLPEFIRIRRENYSKLLTSLKQVKRYLLFPDVLPDAKPSWFGFPIVVREGAPFTKLDFVKYLEDHKIATRSIFAGNLMRHPAYLNRKDVRVAGSLANSDFIMNNGFWIGVCPAVTDEMISYVVKIVINFFDKTSRRPR